MVKLNKNSLYSFYIFFFILAYIEQFKGSLLHFYFLSGKLERKVFDFLVKTL